MDVTQVLTTADRLLYEIEANTEKLKTVRKRFEEKCANIEENLDLISEKTSRDLEIAYKIRYFCELTPLEQRKFLKEYRKEPNDNKKK